VKSFHLVARITVKISKIALPKFIFSLSKNDAIFFLNYLIKNHKEESSIVGHKFAQIILFSY
jgi:hypothetical protein